MAKLTAIQNGNVIDGRYRITSTLGEGTFGTVYEAEHMQLHRRVAIKLLRHCDPAKLERFRREAEAISKISQENVVAIHDYGELEDGRPFIVLDLIKGQDLADLFATRGTLSIDETIHVARGVLLALQAAHEQGIVHRDLKPSNVILGSSGESNLSVKVVDFGLAKPLHEEGVSLTQTGDTIGTPQYMSPEQCRGQNLDGRSDIYSLGLILYEGLAGKPFVECASLFDCMAKHVEGQEVILPDSVPDDLAAVIRKSLTKERKDRYASADEMLAALRLVRLGKNSIVTRRFRQKSMKMVTFGIVTFLLCFLTGIGVMIATGTWMPDPVPVELKPDMTWHDTTFGGVHFTAPDVQIRYGSNSKDHELIQTYDLDPNGYNFIEVKQYPESNVFDEIKKQHERHTQYPGFQAVQMLFSRPVGVNNSIAANESIFFFKFDKNKPPAEERHVLMDVDHCTYKFKLHSAPPNELTQKWFERMLASIHH
jgi:serine/threonine protein kinase